MKSSHEWTQEKLAEMFGWSHFHGFTASSCGSCRKTANVPIGAGWFCKCGAWNTLLWEHNFRPHDKPDIGPSAHMIEAASRSGEKK